ncbi:helix-turn-helix domain-containing protein [Paenibacillus sp. WQ 127069]|uniref:Helix-turn-helix domain-containing protein n=1 Tax=Paenibacillus baimaensis TaxID=2982185 RepID=A0ABT2UPJ4_9BACL|nr:helix-turn-helix domain-containing protein [Paenibacillus sp. WQ 127069]MCU6796561.1 helix-turn-helix domain-containing protein [Paenibacillus sp. WQ 127069]
MPKPVVGKLQMRIVLLLCCAVLLPICLLSAINYRMTLSAAQNQTEKYSRQLLEQAVREHSIVHEQMKNVMYDILGSMDKYFSVLGDYYTNAQTLYFIKEMEQRVAIHSKYIASIELLDLERRVAYSTTDNRLTPFDRFADQELLSGIARKDDYTGIRYLPRPGLITYYMYVGVSEPQSGVIAINVKDDDMRQWASVLLAETGGSFYVSDAKGHLLLGGGEEETSAALRELAGGNTEPREGNRRYLLLREQATTSKFEYALIIPYASFAQAAERQSLAFAVIGLVAALLSLAIVILASRYLYHPIVRIMSAIGSRAPAASEPKAALLDESGYIVGAFSRLTDESERLSDAVRHHRETIRHNLLTRLLQGRPPELAAASPLLELPWPHPVFTVLSLHVHWGELREDYSELDMELTNYAIRNVAAETLHPLGVAETLARDADTIVVICNTAQQETAGRWLAAAAEVRHNVKRYIRLSVDIGIGSAGEGLAHAAVSYQESLQCLSYNRLFDPTKLTHYCEIAETTARPRSRSFVWSNYEADYVKHIRHGRVDGARALCERLREDAKDAQASVAETQIMTLQLSASLLLLLEEYGFDKEEGGLRDEVTTLLATSRFAETTELLASLSERLIASVERKRAGVNQEIMEKAAAWIEQDMTLTAERIAAQLSLSPPSLNKLFRERKGITAGEYILRTKVERAKRLLLETDDKIEDIAAKTGYASTRGFYKVFKELTGTTPTEFRKMHG